jgi:hypothetical protein
MSLNMVMFPRLLPDFRFVPNAEDLPLLRIENLHQERFVLFRAEGGYPELAKRAVNAHGGLSTSVM